MVRRILMALFLAALSVQVCVAQEDAPPTLEQLAQQLSDLQDTVSDLRDDHDTLEGNHANLEAAMIALAQAMTETQTEMKQLIQSDANGNRYINFDTVLLSQEGREQMQRAVQDSLQSTGTFQVHNKTTTHQGIYVNNRYYSVAPGAQLVLRDIPVGTVSTQVPGREMMTWSITAPSYFQSIDIVPVTTAAYAPTPASTTWVWDAYLGGWVRQ